MSASLPIQATIYEVLNAGLSIPIYDNVPDNAIMPYAVIGDDTLIQFDTDDITNTIENVIQDHFG